MHHFLARGVEQFRYLYIRTVANGYLEHSASAPVSGADRTPSPGHDKNSADSLLQRWASSAGRSSSHGGLGRLFAASPAFSPACGCSFAAAIGCSPSVGCTPADDWLFLRLHGLLRQRRGSGALVTEAAASSSAGSSAKSLRVAARIDSAPS
jgi:hypothetical protein